MKSILLVNPLKYCTPMLGVASPNLAQVLLFKTPPKVFTLISLAVVKSSADMRNAIDGFFTLDPS